MRSGFLVFPLAAVLLVAGCSPGGDPTPSTTAVVTSPAATPTPTPSATSSQDALHAEAERVLRAAFAAQAKWEQTGDYSEFPPELAEYYSPEYLAAVRSYFDDQAKKGLRVEGGLPTIRVTPAPDHSKDGSVTALQGCHDARGLTIVDANGEFLQEGVLVSMFAYFKFYDGHLKIFDIEGEEAAECPIT